MVEFSLRRAIEQEDLVAIREQIAAGGDPDSPVSRFDTPLTAAAKAGALKVLDVLLDANADVNLPAPSGLLPLCGAIANGKVAAASKLIKRGADVNALGGSPIRSAVYHEQFQCVCILLDAGASPNPPGSGLSPLRNAVGVKTKRSTRIVEALIRAGADVNEGPQTPLMRACAEGATEMVHLLIDAGADVNAYDKVLGTALMRAAFFGRADVVRLLLDAGADPTLRFPSDHRDSPNMSAYDVAVNRKKKKVVELLQGV